MSWSVSSRPTKRNVYPRADALVGSTRCPLVTSPATSPSSSRRANSGVHRKLGRPSARPRDLENSSFVTGFGAVALTGPVT